MSEHEDVDGQEDFAALLARSGATPRLYAGQTVKGRIIQVGAETAFVDVHGKGEALIDRAELLDEAGNLRLGVGDEIEATVISTGEQIRLSHRLLRGAQAREALEVAARTGVPVEGKVTAVIKGGYEVAVGGLRAFCPFSQMDVRRVATPDELLRRVLEFRITRYADGGRNIVLSRRQLLEAAAAREAEETRKKLVPGAVLPGTVASLADFGVFVDLGGVQGLVPLSEISHSRPARPADRVHVGQAVTVKVLKVDAEQGRVTLSLKALDGDPWSQVPGAVRERQVLRGRAVRATDFGVFVELFPGVDGLLHTTEIPRSRQGELKEAAATGAEIAVVVRSVDADRRRIGLGLAPEGATVGADLASTLAANALLEGTVERVEPYGVFVRLGTGEVGLVPNAEMGTDRGADHRKAFPPGTAVKVVVIALEDSGRRIRLSRARALQEEERAATAAYLREASGRGGGFGLTLGEVLRQSRRK
jgi:small subunit ribosomal protein S1